MVRIPLGTVSAAADHETAAVPVVIDAATPILAYEPCAALAARMNDWSEG